LSSKTAYDKLAANAGSLWLRALLAVAYAFGFRRSELLGMKVAQINLIDKTITLYRGETKSGEPRLVKMTQDVAVLLTACVQGKGPEARVFTRNGEPIVDIRDAWETMCTTAGLPGILLHDLRRSAIRNMVRRRIPERVAMAISGHKTRSVFDRYNIVSEDDLAEAALKIEQGAKTQSELGEIQSGCNLVKVGPTYSA